MNELTSKTLIAMFPENCGNGFTRQTKIQLCKTNETSYIKIKQTTKHKLTDPEHAIDEVFIDCLHWDMLADAIITCCDLTQNEEL